MGLAPRARAGRAGQKGRETCGIRRYRGTRRGCLRSVNSPRARIASILRTPGHDAVLINERVDCLRKDRRRLRLRWYAAAQQLWSRVTPSGSSSAKMSANGEGFSLIPTVALFAFTLRGADDGQRMRESLLSRILRVQIWLMPAALCKRLDARPKALPPHRRSLEGALQPRCHESCEARVRPSSSDRISYACSNGLMLSIKSIDQIVQVNEFLFPA